MAERPVIVVVDDGPTRCLQCLTPSLGDLAGTTAWCPTSPRVPRSMQYA